MIGTDPALWARLSSILDIALDLPTDRRDGYLEQACLGDRRLREAAVRMLGAAERTSTLLDRPVEIAPALLHGSRDGARLRSAAWAPVMGASACDPDAVRFLPGVVVGGRYRIVSLIGRGGMGEVYRADDLRLGSPVALKFLPPGLERDSPALQRLVRELRTARRIAHPNVCRVWDIGEHDSIAFLTMEYVDGESLAGLLKRIGCLPSEKAVDVARQICAGLAATHDEEILHRDLKPANVMIDGRGRVRIVDFGIARLTEEVRASDVGLGTPGYMSPEQLGGREVTVRSDIYVLGLLLYELFTGRRAFQAATIDELRRMQETTAPTKPTRLIEGLDPAIERVILRCLSRQQEDRPASAREVAAGLPGADPLEAVIAAGETPSPGLVADSGPSGTLSPPRVLALGMTWCALFVFVIATSGQTTIVGRVPFQKPAPELAASARSILESIGYTDRPVDTVQEFWADGWYLSWLRARDVATGRWDALGAHATPALFFSHRGSARYLVPKNEGGGLFERVVAHHIDPPLEAGDTFVLTTLQGHLRHLLAVPPVADFSGGRPAEPDWRPLFAAAGLDAADFTPRPPTRIPPGGFDARAAWSGVLRDAGDLPVRIEAAAWHGKPVYFETVFPFHPYWSETGSERRLSGRTDESPLWTLWILVIIAIGGALVMRNLRAGRIDRRGAARCAAFVFTTRMLFWVFAGHHVPLFFDEIDLSAFALGRSLAAAAVTWSLFIALEPDVRRYWPRGLHAWNRLLVGRVRDPLVGRDLLVGVLSGLMVATFWDRLHLLLPEWLGIESLAAPEPPWNGFLAPPPDSLLGGRFVVGALLTSLLSAMYVTLALWVLLLAMRIVLRKRSLMALAFVAYWTALSSAAVESGYQWTGLLCGLCGATVVVATYERFGLLAVSGAALTFFLCSNLPMTLNVTAPYFGIGLVGILAVTGLAAYGAVVSLGRPRIAAA